MSDSVNLDKCDPAALDIPPDNAPGLAAPERNMPGIDELQKQLDEASLLVDDIVLKNYLSRLTDFEMIPLDDSLKKINDIRLFQITEMVYQKDEYSTYKFASVFNAVQNLNCGVFVIADSDGKKTDFYMGVRSLDDKHMASSLSDTLKNALTGQFPGVKTSNLLEKPIKKFLANIQSENIAAVSCIGKNKDEQFNDNERFIQGLEKLALAMQGQRYTAVVLAKSTPTERLMEERRACESLYTQLSPFAKMQLSYGTNTALNISDAFSRGTTTSTSHSTNHSTQIGKSESNSTGKIKSETEPSRGGKIKNGVAAAVGIVGIAAAYPTCGISLLVANAVGTAINAIPTKTTTAGESENKSEGGFSSAGSGEADSEANGTNENHTRQYGSTSGTSDNMQLTMQNKTLLNTLERIDEQLKRIDECESLGMWECAAYFLSDSQETAEMAAGTYKALMKGEKSGVETSAVNFWGGNLKELPADKRAILKRQLPLLREYITNFVHPVFEYRATSESIPVTAASFVSGNELAIQMGLPRKSVCGFPVIEHADFGKEVVKYNSKKDSNDFVLGKVFSMGRENATEVRLDRDSLAMHTFITGSTGSGKSNTVYEILDQLRKIYNIPFLVVEPAKGEYKNVFGQFSDVTVYGTNPKKSSLLRINPFRFPPDIHVLEHLDRLVEMFNVCWPMYAAMPAILKEAMEKAYVAVGWNLGTSENSKGEVFPNFADLLEQIEGVIGESKYSADSKGDYTGALCTRVRSLTNGLNGQIFTKADLTDEDLFDKNVIVDLSRVGSTETKSLIMGLLVMKLNEYRMTSGKTNSPLSHITVLEEAHNLLKRTSTEQLSESSNLLGKSVELLANSIAEMRTYGEGFIIADQSPGLLDMSVIRNTNTKIILRLPEQSDRELVGFAASLDKEQIEELSKLERGVAAIYQNDWVEPVLVKINKCGVDEQQYNITGEANIHDAQKTMQQLICLLLQGRVKERLDFDIDEIERNVDALALSAPNHKFVEERLNEYKANGSLTIWNESSFQKLSRRLVDLLGTRERVENLVSTANDYDELSEKLSSITKSLVPNASEQLTITLNQCLMKDLSAGQDEPEKREKIYKQWVEAVKERAVKI